MFFRIFILSYAAFGWALPGYRKLSHWGDRMEYHNLAWGHWGHTVEGLSVMVLTLPRCTVLLGGGQNRILRYGMWAHSGEAICDGPVALYASMH